MDINTRVDNILGRMRRTTAYELLRAVESETGGTAFVGGEPGSAYLTVDDSQVTILLSGDGKSLVPFIEKDGVEDPLFPTVYIEDPDVNAQIARLAYEILEAL